MRTECALGNPARIGDKPWKGGGVRRISMSCAKAGFSWPPEVSSGKDRARSLEYALGCAGECEEWSMRESRCLGMSERAGVNAPLSVVSQCAQGSPMRTQYALRNSWLYHSVAGISLRKLSGDNSESGDYEMTIECERVADAPLFHNGEADSVSQREILILKAVEPIACRSRLQLWRAR